MATVSERARRRASINRLRAIKRAAKNGTVYYTVHNLSNGHKYTVGYVGGQWQCHCEGAKGGRRCQHVQRVLDREEQRTKRDALAMTRDIYAATTAHSEGYANE